ncbi:recombinase family protein [Peribacillus sp. SCS-155]|uniref:recombinase family protein n=1 Tax=Peribacillus sedimenti TaxID=3115297 RepID=UPI003906795C
MNFKAAVGYARTSGLINPKTSIPNQIRSIEKYCHEKEIKLHQIYVDECKSGTKVQGRDSYIQMMTRLDMEYINTVVVSNFDRLNRDSLEFTKTVTALKHKGIGVLSIMQNANSIELTPIQISMAGLQVEMENNFRADRLKDGRKRMQSLGKFHKNNTPFGYDLDDERYLQINNKEAEIVKFIFDKFEILKNYSHLLLELKEKYEIFGPWSDTKKIKIKKFICY